MEAKGKEKKASLKKSNEVSPLWEFSISRAGYHDAGRLSKVEQKQMLRLIERSEMEDECRRYITPINSKNGTKLGKCKPTYRLEPATWRSTRTFLRLRGWKEWSPKDGNTWNLFWRENRVQAFVIDRCLLGQRLNKLRDTRGITVKDRLSLRLAEMVARYGSIFDISPKTWTVPNQLEDFYDFEKTSTGNSNPLYICKPARLSRGRNIFLFRTGEELKKKLNEKNVFTRRVDKTKKEISNWVIQEYLQNPHLISGYKYDLRLYVLVTSLWPLKLFLYKKGLVRFATSKFDLSHSNDLFAHLTNSSINKKSSNLKKEKGAVGKGCKWLLSKLFEYMKEQGIDTELLWQKIKHVILLTVLPMVGKSPQDACTFEYFGFDIMIDANLRPYIVEVNSGPAMSLKMKEDAQVKISMLNDLFNLLRLDNLSGIPPSILPPPPRILKPRNSATPVPRRLSEYNELKRGKLFANGRIRKRGSMKANATSTITAAANRNSVESIGTVTLKEKGMEGNATKKDTVTKPVRRPSNSRIPISTSRQGNMLKKGVLQFPTNNSILDANRMPRKVETRKEKDGNSTSTATINKEKKVAWGSGSTVEKEEKESKIVKASGIPQPKKVVVNSIDTDVDIIASLLPSPPRPNRSRKIIEQYEEDGDSSGLENENVDRKRHFDEQRNEYKLDLSQKGSWDVVFPFNEETEKLSEELATEFEASKLLRGRRLAQPKQKLLDAYIMQITKAIRNSYKDKKAPW